MAKVILGRTQLTSGKPLTVIERPGYWSIVTIWTDASGVTIGHDNSSATSRPNLPAYTMISLMCSPESAIVAVGATGTNVNYAVQPMPPLTAAWAAIERFAARVASSGKSLSV